VVADFRPRTAAVLVSAVERAGTDCVESLFALTGPDAAAVFAEPHLVAVADALAATAARYPGNDSGSATQLVLFLRAGYYAQWADPAAVGRYGSALRTAVRAALDGFFAAPHSRDVTDANGRTLAEAVTLADSAGENARYLPVVERLLRGFDHRYATSWWMSQAVNNTYLLLWRGHRLTGFEAAVQADPGLTDTLAAFARANSALLGTDRGYLTANAGLELGRFLQDPALRGHVRPLVVQLLAGSAPTGRTAALWAALAEAGYYHDQAHCAAYRTCELPAQLRAAVLTVSRTCSPSIRILAQQLTAAELTTTCASLAGEDTYFHQLVRDDGPVADDRNADVEVVVFHSSADYRTYAGTIFDTGTDNGGIYLEGDPAAPGNQARILTYEADWLRPAFQIWNLNHEYTHYLDGRYDLSGDYQAGTGTPTVWWTEGLAEYVSYSYRRLRYADAIAQAGRHTYPLSMLFDTTYADADQARIYNWGYLAVRYLLERHRADVDAVLARYRTGDWAGARAYLTRTIGTAYDADFDVWLTACATGACEPGYRS
jgi:microbial collagenase